MRKRKMRDNSQTRHDDTFTMISQIRSAADMILVQKLKDRHIEGIVPSHGAILIQLFSGKSLSMNVLAEKIGKTPQTVTTLVQKLVRLGYLKTEKSQEDRRTTLVSMTEKGKALKPVFMAISEYLYDIQYQDMDETEIMEFRRLLRKMADCFKKVDIQ